MPDPKLKKRKKIIDPKPNQTTKIIDPKPNQTTNPKKKKRPVLSTDPDDILKTVNRDYKNYNARYLGQSAGGRAEFEMTSKTNGSSFTLNRGSAFPAVDKEIAEKNRAKYRNRNKNK